MALVDPNIAMGYRGIEVPNQLAQYGQLAQIQNAQNQNQLAQYQLGAAQRAEAKDIARINALSKAGADDTAIATALLQTGDLKGYSDFLKTRRETQEADARLVDTKLKQSRSFLDTIDLSDPDAPNKYIAWHEANHRDPVLGPVLAARGITADQSRQRIMDAIQKGPAEFANLVNQSKLGSEKFIEMNKPQLSTKDTGGQLIDRTFEPLTGKITSLGTTAKTMTPGEVASNQVARGQLAVAQGNLANSRERLAWERANPGFELKEAEDGSIVGVNKRTLQAFPITMGGGAPAATPSVGGQPAPAGAPVAGAPLRGKGTALTESQGNATAYGMRMKEANAILEPLEKAGKTNTGLIKNVVGGTVGLIPLIGDKLEDVSGSVFNALPQVLGGLSPEQQQVAQARINFITAILRKESGAAIGRDEFATAEKNYFPKPGDDAAAIAQKQQARRTAIKAMEIQAGPGARQMGGAGGLPGASANDPLGLGIK